MAFRRDGLAGRAWSLWLDRQIDALIRCGVPDYLYAEERLWVGILEERGWDAEAGWRVEMLTPSRRAIYRSSSSGNTVPTRIAAWFGCSHP
jgi:hypothetical protein